MRLMRRWIRSFGHSAFGSFHGLYPLLGAGARAPRPTRAGDVFAAAADARRRLASLSPRRVAAAAGLAGWLVWSVYFPDTLPLYGVHIANVRLAREIAVLERRIANLSAERAYRRQVLARLGWDELYWEAMARRAGMLREREVVVAIERSGRAD